MKKPIKFLSFAVMFSLLVCIAYTVVAVIFQYKLGVEISPTVSESVYKVFGTEIGACALIVIAKKIVNFLDTKNRVDLMKENEIEPSPEDFREQQETTYYGDMTY